MERSVPRRRAAGLRAGCGGGHGGGAREEFLEVGKSAARVGRGCEHMGGSTDDLEARSNVCFGEENQSDQLLLIDFRICQSGHERTNRTIAVLNAINMESKRHCQKPPHTHTHTHKTYRRRCGVLHRSRKSSTPGGSPFGKFASSRCRLGSIGRQKGIAESGGG